MAINKDRNVMLQVTFPKEDAEQLEVLRKAFQNNGINVSKSDILVKAFREYVKLLVFVGSQPIKQKDETKEDKKTC